MSKFDLNKMRGGFSWMERFSRRHTVEVLTAAAIVVAAFSSWAHFFLGTLGWSMLFLVIGAAAGIFLPGLMDKWLKKIYYNSGSARQTSMFVAEGVKIAVALFLPFVYFAFLGVLTGTAYQYYVHYSHSKNKGNKAA